MKARVGTLAVGARFGTLLTGRQGVVRGVDADGVDVTLDDGPAFMRWKTLHPDVVVETQEVVH